MMILEEVDVVETVVEVLNGNKEAYMEVFPANNKKRKFMSMNEACIR